MYKIKSFIQFNEILSGLTIEKLLIYYENVNKIVLAQYKLILTFLFYLTIDQFEEKSFSSRGSIESILKKILKIKYIWVTFKICEKIISMWIEQDDNIFYI